MSKGVGVTKMESYDPKQDGGCAVAFGYDVDMPTALNGLEYLYDRDIPWLYGEQWGATSHLNEDVTRYIEKLCTIAEQHAAVLHFFLQGNAFERPHDLWTDVVARGHGVDSHMYNHIDLLEEPLEVIGQQAAKTRELLLHKLGTPAFGVRGPGGYMTGLDGREDVQRTLLEAGITWVSTKYPLAVDAEGKVSAATEPMTIAAIPGYQPYFYSTGLLEIPVCGYQDRHYFDADMGGDPARPVDDWIAYLKRAVDFAYEHRLFVAFAVHPSTSFKHDPEARYLSEVLAHCRQRSDILVCTFPDIYRWVANDAERAR